MAKIPTYEQMAKNVAEKALDEFLYDGKSIREWMKIIVEQEQKWTPVSERLPEDGISCICTVYNTDVYRDNIQVYDDYLVYDEYTEQWIDYDMELCPYDVIAWMPLPKPYEPQESEDGDRYGIYCDKKYFDRFANYLLSLDGWEEKGEPNDKS